MHYLYSRPSLYSPLCHHRNVRSRKNSSQIILAIIIKAPTSNFYPHAAQWIETVTTFTRLHTRNQHSILQSHIRRTITGLLNSDSETYLSSARSVVSMTRDYNQNPPPRPSRNVNTKSRAIIVLLHRRTEWAHITRIDDAQSRLRSRDIVL